MMNDDFDGAREPMRAIRDLISACEGLFGADQTSVGALRRAQDGFATLGKLFGDERPAEDIGDVFGDVQPMIEPSAKTITDLREALALTSGALQCTAKLLPRGEKHVVIFTGDWLRIAPMSVASILDRANAALKPAGASDAA